MAAHRAQSPARGVRLRVRVASLVLSLALGVMNSMPMQRRDSASSSHRIPRRGLLLALSGCLAPLWVPHHSEAASAPPDVTETEIVSTDEDVREAQEIFRQQGPILHSETDGGPVGSEEIRQYPGGVNSSLSPSESWESVMDSWNLTQKIEAEVEKLGPLKRWDPPPPDYSWWTTRSSDENVTSGSEFPDEVVDRWVLKDMRMSGFLKQFGESIEFTSDGSSGLEYTPSQIMEAAKDWDGYAKRREKWWARRYGDIDDDEDGGGDGDGGEKDGDDDEYYEEDDDDDDDDSYDGGEEEDDAREAIWTMWKDCPTTEYTIDTEGMHKRVRHNLQRIPPPPRGRGVLEWGGGGEGLHKGEDLIVLRYHDATEANETGAFLENLYESPRGGMWMLVGRKGMQKDAQREEIVECFRRLLQSMATGRLSNVTHIRLQHRKLEYRLCIGVNPFVEASETALCFIAHRIRELAGITRGLAYVSYQNFDRYGPAGYSMRLAAPPDELAQRIRANAEAVVKRGDPAGEPSVVEDAILGSIDAAVK